MMDNLLVRYAIAIFGAWMLFVAGLVACEDGGSGPLSYALLFVGGSAIGFLVPHE